METKLKNYGSKYRACQLKLKHANFKLPAMPQEIHNSAEHKKQKHSNRENEKETDKKGKTTQVWASEDSRGRISNIDSIDSSLFRKDFQDYEKGV